MASIENKGYFLPTETFNETRRNTSLYFRAIHSSILSCGASSTVSKFLIFPFISLRILVHVRFYTKNYNFCTTIGIFSQRWRTPLSKSNINREGNYAIYLSLIHLLSVKKFLPWGHDSKKQTAQCQKTTTTTHFVYPAFDSSTHLMNKSNFTLPKPLLITV